MSVLLWGGDATRIETPEESSDDPFVRLKQVLKIHHAHPPRGGAREFTEPESPDDCFVVRTRNIRQYHLEGRLKRVRYQEIRTRFAEARLQGSKLAPYAPAEVFAPAKVVVAEVTDPIRAVLTFHPVYPWQNKLATLLPGVPLSLAYAAVAVLNSRYGETLYGEALAEHPPRSKSPHGPKVHALYRVKIAKRGREERYLWPVVQLAYQLHALHEARQAGKDYFRSKPDTIRSFMVDADPLLRQYIENRKRQLNRAISDLLDIDEDAERKLGIGVPSSEDFAEEEVSLLPWDINMPQAGRQWPRFSFTTAGFTPKDEDLPFIHHWEHIINGKPPIVPHGSPEQQNERRLALIRKHFGGGLSLPEQAEWAQLEIVRSNYINREFPLPFETLQQFKEVIRSAKPEGTSATPRRHGSTAEDGQRRVDE
jgi:hypothetical protein